MTSKKEQKKLITTVESLLDAKKVELGMSLVTEKKKEFFQT